MADPWDELYAAPLDAFVAERTRLARGLADEGDKAGAAELKAAKKPTASAWVVNQIAHTRPEIVKELLAVTGDVVRAQLDAAGSDEDRRRLVTALERQRAIEDELRAAAREVAGRPTVDLLSRILDNFRRGALQPEGRELLRSGRLTRDLPPQDFGALLAELPKGRLPPRTPVARPTPEKGHAVSRPAKRRDTQRERAAAARARKEATERRRAEAARAREQAADRRRAVAAARSALARAEKRADALRSGLREAERAVRDAKAALHDAGEAA